MGYRAGQQVMQKPANMSDFDWDNLKSLRLYGKPLTRTTINLPSGPITKAFFPNHTNPIYYGGEYDRVRGNGLYGNRLPDQDWRVKALSGVRSGNGGGQPGMAGRSPQRAPAQSPGWTPPRGDIPRTPLYNDEMHHGGYDPAQRLTKPIVPMAQLPDGYDGAIMSLSDYGAEAKRGAHYTEVHFRDGSVGTYGPNGQRLDLDTTHMVRPNIRDPKYGLMYYDRAAQAYLPTRKFPRPALRG